jgi:hypothetical protein
LTPAYHDTSLASDDPGYAGAGARTSGLSLEGNPCYPQGLWPPSASDDCRLMPSVELSRRVERVVGCPPLSEMGELQRREFHEALLDAESFEDLPGKWQAAILEAEQNRPKLPVVNGD